MFEDEQAGNVLDGCEEGRHLICLLIDPVLCVEAVEREGEEEWCCGEDVDLVLEQLYALFEQSA